MHDFGLETNNKSLQYSVKVGAINTKRRSLKVKGNGVLGGV